MIELEKCRRSAQERDRHAHEDSIGARVLSRRNRDFSRELILDMVSGHYYNRWKCMRSRKCVQFNGWSVRLLSKQLLARLFTADWLRPTNRMIEYHFYPWGTRGSNRSEPHRQVFELSGDAIVSTFVCA
jgi:hypothetical protein